MLHPSYTDLINAVNSEVEPGEQMLIQSRYSIVIATAKRARQLIAGDEPLVPRSYGKKPLSIAVEELYENKVKIVSDENTEEDAIIDLSQADDLSDISLEELNTSNIDTTPSRDLE